MDKKREWFYLFDIIRYSLSGGECPEIKGIPDWEYLYSICKRHKIESMVSNGLENMPQEKLPSEEVRQKLRKKLNTDTAREAVQYFSLEELLEEFEEQGVDCMPLKGALLKQFYEKPALRTMADLDILYRPEQKEQVRQVLTGLDYEEVTGTYVSHHESYTRRPYMDIEMHHCLVPEGEKYKGYYDNVWERIRLCDGKKHIYEFSWEDYYIYMLVHLAKHFRYGGSGIRSIVDIWVFIKNMKDKLDWTYLEKELESIDLKEFDIHIRKLAEVWFEGHPSEAFYDDLTVFIVDSGIYGTRKHYIARKVSDRIGDSDAVTAGELAERIRVIFLPMNYMKMQYSYLNKYPFLLPVAWLQRIFRTIFKRREKVRQVLKRVNIDQRDTAEIKDLFGMLGL